MCMTAAGSTKIAYDNTTNKGTFHVGCQDWECISGMALGFFNLGPGTRMFGQIGVPRICWGPKILVTLCEKKSMF